jgi:hypothetical protein
MYRYFCLIPIFPSLPLASFPQIPQIFTDQSAFRKKAWSTESQTRRAVVEFVGTLLAHGRTQKNVPAKGTYK